MEKLLFLHKYQPLYFKDFEMDEEMNIMLNTLLSMNNLNILFMGNIGTGKTNLLNACIREYYKGTDPAVYKDNVLYINSLKEQGINYYRNDVKTFCQTCSSVKGKKKIILLDDIDIINEQSQQVFRNCIDKYSQNVHFITSCNNSQNVIESLQSRLIIIKIKPLQKQNVEKIIKKIIVAESINITETAVQFILDICNNNIKNMIIYMEKIKLLNKDVDLQLATVICTNISFIQFNEYTNALINGKLTTAIKILHEIYDRGYSVMDILDNYFVFVKFTTLLTETQKYEIIPIICKYISIFYNIHEDEIELAIFSNNLFKLFQSSL
jgi:replication factor C small subunit